MKNVELQAGARWSAPGRQCCCLCVRLWGSSTQLSIPSGTHCPHRVREPTAARPDTTEVRLGSQSELSHNNDRESFKSGSEAKQQNLGIPRKCKLNTWDWLYKYPLIYQIPSTTQLQFAGVKLLKNYIHSAINSSSAVITRWLICAIFRDPSFQKPPL